jgi:uncharacterized protein YqhQ
MKRQEKESLKVRGLGVRPIARKTTIGGQALIEGLMMIGPTRRAMAVRKPDGSIFLEEMQMSQFAGAANWPFIRGSIRLFRQMVSGTKALLRSAEFMEEAETVPPVQPIKAEDSGLTAEQPAPQTGEQSAAELAADPAADPAAEPAAKPAAAAPATASAIDRFFARHQDLFLYGSAALGLLFSVGLFILLPNFLTGFIRQFAGITELHSARNTILANLIEGLIRIIIFVAYLFLASRLKDIKRVWMYHGAEHKTIACYEARQELTVENVRSFSRFHPRCGTAFLFIVIIVSIIVFSFAGWWNRWLNLLIRFALVPVVAGIAYEILRIAGRFDNRFTRAIAAPGLWLQRLTTAEPDDSMLEVAIVAMQAVIPADQESDNW